MRNNIITLTNDELKEAYNGVVMMKELDLYPYKTGKIERELRGHIQDLSEAEKKIRDKHVAKKENGEDYQTKIVGYNSNDPIETFVFKSDKHRKAYRDEMDQLAEKELELHLSMLYTHEDLTVQSKGYTGNISGPLQLLEREPDEPEQDKPKEKKK